MSEVNKDCEKLLQHIKKCQIATNWDGYVDAGVIGYFAKLPFKRMYSKHFTQVNSYIEKLNCFLAGQGLELRLETFEEYNNEAILYEVAQLSSLAYKQYQHRVNYFNRLTEQVHRLMQLLNQTEIKKEN